MTIVLFCDETGAKGGSKNQQQVEGEFGIFSGLLMKEEQVEDYLAFVERIDKTFFSEERSHIVSLNREDQEAIQKQMFDYIKSNDLRIIYEAIYVQGFHNYHKLVADTEKRVEKSSSSKVRLSKHDINESLHAELFVGLTAKAIAFVMDEGESILEVKLDTVDQKVHKSLKKQVDELFDIGSVRITKASGINLETREIERGEVQTQTNLGSDYDVNVEFGSTVVTEKWRALGADLLSYSLYKHFTERNKVEIGLPLNAPSSISGHVLADSFLYLRDGTVPDTIYRYPKN